MLHAINEAKKHENALADMAYGEKKIIDEYNGPAYYHGRAVIPFPHTFLSGTIVTVTRITRSFNAAQQNPRCYGQQQKRKVSLLPSHRNTFLA